MTNNVLCDAFAERLADLLERDVDEATRAALEAHALSCDECGSLLADLRKLRIDASSLPTLAPSRDLWDGIAERIDAPVIPLKFGGERGAITSHRWRRLAAIVAAAGVLVAVSSLTTHYVTVRTASGGTGQVVAQRGVTETPSVESPAAAPVAVAQQPASGGTSSGVPRSTASAKQPVTAAPTARFASSKPSAEQVYAIEIARLRTIVAQRRSQLDPATISVIERNLTVIDDAIAQCKLALAKDPASRFLMESLNNALETKVELLRTAALLPAHS